ncbi:MAG: hypothetical protein CBD54_003100 [Alphaproteobacteria bacterium TMED194]|nr:MAG: hypothetical protein CBD54_003100 [Alphaproteobacteria bacterium TMED194]
MAFLVSPGVQVKEVDLTNVVPAVATSIGAIAGAFQKGPVSSVTTITSEEDLIKNFGKPNDSNFETFFSAANFLQYTNSLRVVRAESGVVNAVASGTAILIRDTDHYQGSFAAGEASVGEWAARSAGTWGNSIGVSICATATAYEEMLTSSNQTVGEDAVGSTSIAVDNIDLADDEIHVGDIISFFTDSAGTTPVTGEDGKQYEVTAIDTSTNVATIKRLDDPNGGGVHNVIPDNSFIKRRWRFYDRFDGAPGTSAWATQNGRGSGDEIHVVVYDTTGDITGFDVDSNGNRQNAIIETFANMSKNPNAKTAQGNTNYYPNVIYNQSENIFWMDHNSGGSNWGTDTTSAYTAVDTPTATNLASGTDDYAVTAGEIESAYDKFSDTESIDINLVIGGPSSIVADTSSGQDTHVTMITDLVEKRKDCVAFVSPHRGATVNVANDTTQTENVKTAFDLCPSSSYVVFDSGYKYMYDKYNDEFRFVPLNGDIAGLCANTDRVADSFFSPAGFNRGNIRGAIKLSYNPNQAQRDILYRARINPVVNFPGQGVVLFGDKTALTKPSAFDRINVRRLFLLLEKAIATAAKFQLFEFNDEFTRAQFRNLVEPFLRDIQGRRGISDFRVIADASNNTGEVIDRNEFVADIFVKPARSINFITLSFIATRTGVAFTEVGGA